MRSLIFAALALTVAMASSGLAQQTQPGSVTNTAGPPTETSPELDAIRAQSKAFIEAFGKHDAKAVASLWTENAEYIDDSGTMYEGRDAIEQVYAGIFAENPNAKIRMVIDSLRLLSDSVAIEDGRALVDPAPEGGIGVSKYTVVHVKTNGQWEMASVRDRWVETIASRESTGDLGWLIGTWEAEEHGVRMESVFRWVANGMFVERTHTTTQVDGTKSSGVQLIGWNPAEGHVQSWTFSPDGGHAVGVWSMTPVGWISETRGVTGDGITTTSVNQLRRLDDNAYVWQSTQRTAGDVALPDTDEVVIKRVPSSK
ncbi:SnoaL-like domain protein [Novipirellula aureliae]|uniref:SnoaL-like domain protein n=1 Tax=Novipirellula aureliae TaxID=2527966 RepID=A0A5C6EBL0_9BACT|nr:SgcJ/EcaC family oxidoreductase [Novipirellula aureliae]TWU45865.1 SnoaL-like domain protein [Novipirellula aureliae]